MLIKELEIENWKSISKSKEVFDKENIINRPNGTGKSSMFQAIVFALFGKMPSGFNQNTLRQDPNKPCKIRLMFDYKGNEYSVVRQFGNGSHVALKENSYTVATSSRDTYNYINKMVPYNIMSVLWSSTTLSSSSILKPNFLIDHLLEYVFEDPKFLLNHYKKEVFGQNKVVKRLYSQLNNKELEEQNEEFNNKLKEIESVKQKLKEISNFSDSQANRAKIAKESQEELDKGIWNDVLDYSELSRYNSVVGSNDPVALRGDLKGRLEYETSKDDSELLQISTTSLEKIKSKSEEKCHCLICDSNWNESTSDRLQNVIDNPHAIDYDKIRNLQERIKILDTPLKVVRKSNRYYELKKQIDKCKNWQEILNEYDKENNKLWEQLNKLQKEKEQLEKEKSIRKDYMAEKEKLEQLTKKSEIIQSYISQASEYYSSVLTSEASKIISSLNSRYDQIFLEDNEYRISVIDSNMTTIYLLPAVQLSSGEKTLVGVSLILAAHKLFFPDMPLLFDESFSALDKENIVALKRLFFDVNYQTFIITHDEEWLKE